MKGYNKTTIEKQYTPTEVYMAEIKRLLKEVKHDRKLLIQIYTLLVRRAYGQGGTR